MSINPFFLEEYEDMPHHDFHFIENQLIDYGWDFEVPFQITVCEKEYIDRQQKWNEMTCIGNIIFLSGESIKINTYLDGKKATLRITTTINDPCNILYVNAQKMCIKFLGSGNLLFLERIHEIYNAGTHMPTTHVRSSSLKH